jgi:hypothetical protein
VPVYIFIFVSAKQIRDGPFDFSWGGGANPKKNIEHVSNGRKKNRTSLIPAKKNIEHKKILN